MTIGPHQHAFSHSTGRCVHCEIPKVLFMSFAGSDSPPPPNPPRVLVDLDDLEWLLAYAKFAFRYLDLLGNRADYLLRLAQIAGKAGIDGYETKKDSI